MIRLLTSRTSCLNTVTRRNRYKLIWNDKRSTNKYANQISNLDISRFFDCWEAVVALLNYWHINELMKKKQESNSKPNIFGKYAYLATWAASLLLCEHVGIVDLNNAAQGRSQKFAKGDKTGSGTADPQQGPGAEPRWGSEVEAPRSWRHMLNA